MEKLKKYLKIAYGRGFTICVLQRTTLLMTKNIFFFSLFVDKSPPSSQASDMVRVQLDMEAKKFKYFEQNLEKCRLNTVGLVSYRKSFIYPLKFGKIEVIP